MSGLTVREATCSCGDLRVTCREDPVRVSMCHCLDCQRRTGSTFGVQAWFPLERVDMPAGPTRRYVRHAESGRVVAFTFCPTCGSTVLWEADQLAGLVAVAVGSFADQSFPKPGHAVWTRRQHPWTACIDAEVRDHAG